MLGDFWNGPVLVLLYGMRWILILNFIIFFAPFAGATGNSQEGVVNETSSSSTVGSFSTASSGDYDDRNQDNKLSRVHIVLEQLGMLDENSSSAKPSGNGNANAGH